jgi:hypothetical protein
MLANPESTWRRTIEEGEQRSRKIGRTVIVLLIAMGVLGGATYRGYARHAAVCHAFNALDTVKIRYLGEATITGIKRAQELCE